MVTAPLKKYPIFLVFWPRPPFFDKDKVVNYMGDLVTARRMAFFYRNPSIVSEISGMQNLPPPPTLSKVILGARRE